MATAYTLLLAALQLLAMVVANPNLPSSVRDQAISLGNTAIVTANVEIANQATTSAATTTPKLPSQATSTPQSTTPIQQVATLPQFTGIVTSMNNNATFSGWDGTNVVIPGGSTTITVYGSDGAILPNANVIIHNPTNRVIFNSNTDANGELIWDASKTLGGTVKCRIEIPAINYNKQITLVI